MQGKTIKAICAYKGIPLSDVADKMGKTAANFSQQLKRDDFRESDLMKMAEILECECRITWYDLESGREVKDFF